MRSRLLTALGLAVLLVATILYSSSNLTALVLGVILVIGGWEWSAFLAVAVPWRVLYVLVLAVVGLLGRRYTLQTPSFMLAMEVAVAWWGIALAWILWAPTRVGRLGAALAGILSLLPTWVALVRIDAGWRSGGRSGAQWTLFILMLAFATDTGAFFAGRHFGRVALAPRISPNKTWEGVAGGMLLALLVAWIGAVWFRQAAASFVPLCLAAAAFSVIGDLTESLFKRHVHLKDSGRLFPGHGGVLDRIDSISASTPVMALGLVWLGGGG